MLSVYFALPTSKRCLDQDVEPLPTDLLQSISLLQNTKVFCYTLGNITTEIILFSAFVQRTSQKPSSIYLFQLDQLQSIKVLSASLSNQWVEAHFLLQMKSIGNGVLKSFSISMTIDYIRRDVNGWAYYKQLII